VTDGLKQAAFWVGLRQEIYVAFVNQRSIAINLENFNLDRSCGPAPDHIWACRVVVLCADIIRFFFGKDDERSSSGYDRLLESINEWHRCKSSSFTPLYYKEADKGNMFPEIWFISDEHIVGWQHYYISKLLLAAHDPKVPRLGPSRANSLRAIDEEIKGYVKVLCGIALSNPETAPNFTFVYVLLFLQRSRCADQSPAATLVWRLLLQATNSRSCTSRRHCFMSSTCVIRSTASRPDMLVMI